MSKKEENQAQEVEETILDANENTATEEQVEEKDATESKIEALEKELQDSKDKHLRLFAEFDNYKKRTSRERIELLGTAAKETVVAMLPVLDDFERAIKASETATEVDSVKEGTQLVYNKINSILTQKGLQPMVSIGETFDVEFHEAITEIPAPNEEMIGKIIDEVEKGYTLNGKIIRFAKVVVGK